MKKPKFSHGQDRNGMDIRFSTVFRNSEGVEIAGTWLDQECGEWAVSTVSITRFSTEQEAIDYFRKRCDLETGLPLKISGSFG